MREESEPGFACGSNDEDGFGVGLLEVEKGFVTVTRRPLKWGLGFLKVFEESERRRRRRRENGVCCDIFTIQ